MDPVTMTALASIFGTAAGGKQLGGVAPPFQAGAMGMDQDEDILAKIRRMSQPTPVMGVNNFPFGMNDSEPAAGPNPEPVGPPDELGKKPIWGRLGGIFGNLDSNLASPSKQLGIGLLGELSPYGALAGLAAAGLLGPNKVFGK